MKAKKDRLLNLTKQSGDNNIHIGIDATNIRQGGGLTHLSQMIKSATIDGSSVRKVSIWCSRSVADQLPDHSWLEKICPAWAEKALPFRMLGQQFALVPALMKAGCDVLFSPGGTLPAFCPIPTVTMSQNMLPFEPKESALFGKWSLMHLKMRLLRITQGRSFRQANGLIFLTRYAKTVVSDALKFNPKSSVIIPHGIEPRFLIPPRQQLSLDHYSFNKPFRLLYVSILLPYKHQLEVANAASLLRAEGFPLTVRFIGADWGNYGKKFSKLLQSLDEKRDFLHWSGAVPFKELHDAYQEADAFIFASSCENLPNILIEAMSAGLPVTASCLGPMPEVLVDAGTYFTPYDTNSISDALRTLISNPDLRKK